MYQVRVGVPPEPPPPQAARVPVATRAATDPATLRRHRLFPVALDRRTGRVPGALGTVHRLRWRYGDEWPPVHGEWCSSHDRVNSIRHGREKRNEHVTGAGQSSGPRPAITDGVVTSLGVRGSTVSK